MTLSELQEEIEQKIFDHKAKGIEHDIEDLAPLICRIACEKMAEEIAIKYVYATTSSEDNKNGGLMKGYLKCMQDQQDKIKHFLNN